MKIIETLLNPIEDFLEFLYHGLDGWIYSATKDLKIEPNKSGYWTQYFFQWPEQKLEIINHIEIQAKTLDVYIAPALFKDPSSKKEYIKYSQVIWVELDGKLPTEKNLPEPSYKIQTSDENHQHWYWKVSDVITNSDIIELYNKSITYNTDGADASGWDANQVLRIPGTFNYKRNNDVVIVSNTDNKIDQDNLNSLPQLNTKTAEINTSNIPDVTQVILKYSWPKQVGDLYLTPQPPECERSTYIVRLAYYCAEIGMDNAEILSILINADERWGKFRDRGDRLRRLSEIISIARFKYPSNKTNNLLPYIGALSLIKSERKLKWIIPNFLESKGSLLLTGPSGVGKTQFSLNIAIALALGKSILDYSIAKQYKILFVSLEMNEEAIQLFLALITKTLPVELLNILEKNLIFLPLGEPLYLNSQEQQKSLISLIQEIKPDGLFIDSLGAAISGDLSRRENVQPYLDWCDRLRNQFNLFTWVIHHHRKANGPNTKPNKLDDVYGDQYIVNRATGVHCLWGSKKRDIIELSALKTRMSRLPNPFLVKRNEDLTFSLYGDAKDIMNSPLIIEGGRPLPPSDNGKVSM